MYLAYKYVGLAILLAEANFNAERLNLPIERPIQESQLTSKLIRSPKTPGSREFGGKLSVGGYAFTDSASRNGRSIQKYDRERNSFYPYGWMPAPERNEKLSHEKSLITTNEAYQLAVGWLRAIDVDVEALGRTNRVEVQQRWFWSDTEPATQILLPLFEVTWGPSESPKAYVKIDGRTKEFIVLQQYDGTFSRRPPDLIRYEDELLAIPDEEFLSYTPLQKSNLVARFAMNWPTPRPRPKYLAYNYVALTVLLAEANFTAERLNLPIRRPIRENQLTTKRVLDPGIYTRFGGRVDSQRYAFDERDKSPARSVTHMEPYGKTAEGEDVLHSKSLITTNEAYQMAVAWLKAIDVDMQELERTNRFEVHQQEWSGTKRFLSPIFDVWWGDRDKPKVRVTVDGKQKKLVHLMQNDTSFSKRPAELIKNVDELKAIPDQEFESYSALQKSNLVARSSAIPPR